MQNYVTTVNVRMYAEKEVRKEIRPKPQERKKYNSLLNVKKLERRYR